MAVDLRNIFAYWESIGVFDIVLPFFLIFAIAYSILTTTKILGDHNKNINALIAAIIGVLFVQNNYLVGILQSFIPNVAMFIIVILMVFLVAGTFLGAKADAKDNAFGIVAIIAIAFVVWALLVNPPYTSWFPTYYFDDQTIATLALVGIFIFIIWFVTKPATGGKGWETFTKSIKDLWGK